jgi:hypothetical protein
MTQPTSAASVSPHAGLKPYLGPVLLHAAGKEWDGKLLTRVVAELTSEFVMTDPGSRTLQTILPAEKSGGLHVQVLTYIRETVPAWAPLSNWRDISHEVIVVGTKGGHVAICSSDNSMRDRIARDIVVARPVAFDVIERAFVGIDAKAMWLSGIHTPTSAKATSKSLLGPALEDALDPLGDQSYFYKAVRTTVDLVQSGKGKPSVVGASPANGRIWLNRPADWDAFKLDLESLIDRTANPPPATMRFAALAQRLNGIGAVSGAYACAIVPTELLSEDDDTLRDLAQLWAYESVIDVTACAGASLEAMIHLEGVAVGRVKLDVQYADKVTITSQWMDQPAGAQDRRNEFEEAILRKGWLKIYYERGKTISGGYAYSSAWRDQPFDWEFLDLTDFAVEEEKPARQVGLTLAESIAELKDDGALDNSLFGYVVRRAFTTGWLASDDGSMELADFVHIDPTSQTVTLIHAKGSNSDRDNRQVSVANYEIVVGQAVKNLRHLDRVILADALATGKDKKIARAIWHDGKRQADRSGMIAAAKALGPGYDKRVIVFQPQLTQREHQCCTGVYPTAKGDRLIRMKQLDTLMLSARLSARATGADLIGWADRTPANPVAPSAAKPKKKPKKPTVKTIV